MKEAKEPTKLLFKELASGSPNEEEISELVKQGADLSGEFMGDAIFAAMPRRDDNGKPDRPVPDLKIFELLIELGADVNYVEKGFNCLFHASLCWNVELVELLIRAGADVNCLDPETHESLLNYVSFEQWYEEDNGAGGGEPLAKIVEILKKNGAKIIDNIVADKPEVYLIIDEYCSLFTKRGYIEIEKIPGVDEQLIRDFRDREANQQNWEIERIHPEKSEIRWVDTPDIEGLEKHNEIGLALAKRVKALVGKDIVVKFQFIKPEGIEKFNKNLETLRIE